MSISEGLDRCLDDFIKRNEDMVVAQTRTHQLMESKPLKMKLKEMVRGSGNTLRKDCSFRDQF